MILRIPIRRLLPSYGKTTMNSNELKETILEQVCSAVESTFGQRPEKLDIGYPPAVDLGEFAVECFPLAKLLRKSPMEIAGKVAENIKKSDVIDKAVAKGPYINVSVPKDVLFRDICLDIIEKRDDFLKTSAESGRRVMVEYLAPNTNKPLHLGHLRNGALGISVSRLLENEGYDTIRANLINDRGVHICKSMLAWQRWGDGATPESEGMKGDHFVGKWYVRYSQEAEKDAGLDGEVREMLRKWESKDPDIVKLWSTMNGWVYSGFDETCEKFGMLFDAVYYESETFKLGKDIITGGLKKNVFQEDSEDSENIVFHLPGEKFGTEKDGKTKKVTVLRKDGTSLYITQDLGTALLKVKDHNLDRSVYVVGSEQIHHFQCLFEILGALGYEWAKGCYHLSYGMVYLPDGKMKSREGKVVDADDLVAQIESLAADEIRKRNVDNPLPEDEVARRASIIGVGAIKFYLLRVRAQQDIHFDAEESISFDGFTGPYCQYAYARISGILRTAAEEGLDGHDGDFSLLGNEEELKLIQKLIRFPDETAVAANDLNPSRLAVHIHDTAKTFNQFYNKHKVAYAETPELAKARLALSKATAAAIKKGLYLLGIEVLEKM